MGKEIMVNIEQSKLDEMNGFISDVIGIVSEDFDKLPYETQRKLGKYIWSNYEQQQKEKEILNDNFD
jgi:hypothetical protein